MVVAGEKLPPLTSLSYFGRLSGFRKVPGQKIQAGSAGEIVRSSMLILDSAPADSYYWGLPAKVVRRVGSNALWQV